MEIMLNDLDVSIKASIKSKIKAAMLKEFRTLPLNKNQTEMFDKVLTEQFINELHRDIISHYIQFVQSDAEITLTKDELIDIYFNLV